MITLDSQFTDVALSTLLKKMLCLLKLGMCSLLKVAITNTPEPPMISQIIRLWCSFSFKNCLQFRFDSIAS